MLRIRKNVPFSDQSQLPRSTKLQLCLQSGNTKSCVNYEQIRNQVVSINSKKTGLFPTQLKLRVFAAFIGYTQGCWKVEAEAPPYFFSPPIEIFEPLFSPHFHKFITYSTPYIALQRWLMASLVLRFFASGLPSNQNVLTFAAL